jgi:alcohol dehydrogenase
VESGTFDVHLHTRLVFGAGCAARAGELASELRAQRLLLVTDEGIRRAGHVDRVQACLEAAGHEVLVYDQVHTNPAESDVQACFEAASTFKPDGVIALGGGSTLDTAKGFLFLARDGGRMRDHWAPSALRAPMLPLIAIPTTAGTGSETQSYALISHDDTHAKMACGDAGAAPRVALLDPELTLSMPRVLTAVTGLDTLTHAVEASVTTRRNEISLLFAREAFVLAQAKLPAVLERPDDLGARGAMLRAAALAGLAIESSMLGAAHAVANPLTARFDLEHGRAVGTALPSVVRFNAQVPEAAAEYAHLARLAGLDPGLDAAEALAQRLESILAKAGLPAELSELEVDEALLDELAGEAAGQWTARFNPRQASVTEFRQLIGTVLGRSA